jgi:long-chain acyl-CoA synthetase
MDGTTHSVYCSVLPPSEEGREQEMSDSEPWAYHADGTLVLSLADIIRKRAAATPEAVALSRAGQAATFADIDTGSSRAAAALRAAGVERGGRVVFIGASGPLFAEVMYGTAKCGAIFVPVNSRLAEPPVPR